MQIAVGIDIGWSASRNSFGAVLLDRATKDIARGTTPLVSNASAAVTYVMQELHRLKPTHTTFCVDGPLAGPAGHRYRLVEHLFMSGPFASVPSRGGLQLRLMPAGTRPNSPFLQATTLVTAQIAAHGYAQARLTGAKLVADIVEIFPTLFMAALLPPYAYPGKRSQHTDDLWLTLAGLQPFNGQISVHPALARYQKLITSIEGSLRKERHDLRAAAVSAIAGDWFAAAPPGSGRRNACSFIGHPVEHGFLLPPERWTDQAFRTMLDAHWRSRGGAPLRWLK
jgi:hypothetical protein